MAAANDSGRGVQTFDLGAGGSTSNAYPNPFSRECRTHGHPHRSQVDGPRHCRGTGILCRAKKNSGRQPLAGGGAAAVRLSAVLCRHAYGGTRGGAAHQAACWKVRVTARLQATKQAGGRAGSGLGYGMVPANQPCAKPTTGSCSPKVHPTGDEGPSRALRVRARAFGSPPPRFAHRGRAHAVNSAGSPFVGHSPPRVGVRHPGHPGVRRAPYTSMCQEESEATSISSVPARRRPERRICEARFGCRARPPVSRP